MPSRLRGFKGLQAPPLFINFTKNKLKILILILALIFTGCSETPLTNDKPLTRLTIEISYMHNGQVSDTLNCNSVLYEGNEAGQMELTIDDFVINTDSVLYFKIK